MYIILDFDGTVVEHEYPRIGAYNHGCFEVLKKLQDTGHEIILNTYRIDCNDGTFDKAIDYLNYYPKNLKPISKWTKAKVQPPDWNWEYFKSHKTIYIDDISKGVPLRNAIGVSDKMVDWYEVDRQMQQNNIY